MRRGKEVTSPEGERWRVRRRWMDRRLPDVRERYRELRERTGDVDGVQAFGMIDLADSLPAVIGVAIATAIVVLVVLPLFGVAIELLLVLALLGWGVAGRLVLGRPWIVEAVSVDRPERSRTFAVRGWRASGRAVDEIATAIAAGVSPAPRRGA